jgi:hypothetical protein
MKYFPYFLIIILSYFVCVQHNEIKTLYSKVNALDYKTDNIQKEVFPTTQPDYKETFYLTQLNNSTTLVISVIGFALVIAGIFSFSIIDNKFKVFNSVVQSDFQGLVRKFNAHKTSVDTSINKITNDVTKYGENYKKYESRHNDFEFKLDYNQGNFYANLYNKYVDEKNAEMSLYYALIAFSDFTNCCLRTSVKNDADFKIEKVEYIKNGLKNLTESKEYKINVEFGGTVHNNISNIRKLDIVEIDTLLSKLQASIKYESR